jgi:ArsR family transcriptional regulator
MSQAHLENAKIFKAFCDETRLMVLELLRSGEKCACVLLERVVVGQSTLSHHMKILVESGIVVARKEGKWTYYSINEQGSENAARLLKELTTVTLKEGENANAGCCE